MTSLPPSLGQRVNAALWFVVGIAFLAFALPLAPRFFVDPKGELPSFPLFLVLGGAGIVLGVARFLVRHAFPGLFFVASLLLLCYSALFVPFPADIGRVAHLYACLWLALAIWSLALAVTQHRSNRIRAAV